MQNSALHTPTKAGMIDILQELYGDSWRTPSMLKNEKIQAELKARSAKSGINKLTESSAKNSSKETTSDDSNDLSDTSSKLWKDSNQILHKNNNKKQQKTSKYIIKDDESNQRGTSSPSPILGELSDEVINNSTEYEFKSYKKKEISSDKKKPYAQISSSEEEEPFILKKKTNFNRIVGSSDEESCNSIGKNQYNEKKIDNINESTDDAKSKEIISSSDSEIIENSVILISESDSDDVNKLVHPTLDLSIIKSNEHSKNELPTRKYSNSSDSDYLRSTKISPKKSIINLGLENNYTPNRKFKPISKKTADDSFICDSESSSDDSFVNTPAFYNRLDSIIKKSNIKKSSARKVKVLSYKDRDSESDADDNIMSATICNIESDDIDDLTDGFDDFKISKEVKKDSVKDIAKKLEFEHIENSSKKIKPSCNIYAKNTRISTLSFLESLSENVDIKVCHRDAIPYLKNFKKTRVDLAQTLFELYNRKVFDNKLDKYLEIIWCNNLRTTAGFCQPKRSFKDGVVKYKCTIRLSTKVVDRPCRVRDTLIHELCHAANFEIDQLKNAKHGSRWKYWTRKAETCFPELPEISVLHNYVIEYNFLYECDTCYQRIYRHKNTLNIKEYCVCGFGTYRAFRRQPDGTFKRIKASTRAPSAFAKFVKENYATVKSTFKNHKDCMKELSNLYAKQKKD